MAGRGTNCIQKEKSNIQRARAENIQGLIKDKNSDSRSTVNPMQISKKK